VKYLDICAISIVATHVTIGLSDDPQWRNLTQTQLPPFVRHGFRTLVFSGDARLRTSLIQRLSRRSRHVLIPGTDGSPILSQPPFELPDFELPAISDDDLSAKARSAGIPDENDFFDNFGFHFSMPSDQTTIAGLNSLMCFSLMSEFHFTRQFCLFKGPSRSFPARVDWAQLSGAAAARFENSPSAITAFRALTSIEFPNLEAAAGHLEEFLQNSLFQNMATVGRTDRAAFWMWEVHNRPSWTCPAISMTIEAPEFFVLGLNILPCDSFVSHYHQSHSGRFKEGHRHAWLPEMVNAAFVLRRMGRVLVIQFLEVIGWTFDPELEGRTMTDLAVEIGEVVARFASYLTVIGR
jgi:hypothetical protein